jgi:hypothetical protein
MFLDTRSGNTLHWFFSNPKDWGMRIADHVRECVVFVGRILDKGSREEKRLTRTAFLVGKPLSDGFQTAFYLVTARHVAEPLMSGGEWFIRFNTLDSCDEIRMPSECRWMMHPDLNQAPSVDAAVMPLRLPPIHRCMHIPVSMFATDEIILRHKIGMGSEAYIVGLFTKMTGKTRNIPILRMANVAMMPSEKIPNIKIGNWIGESEVYLLESRSLGGLSGSPVLVHEIVSLRCQRDTTPGAPIVDFLGNGDSFFLGLMNGHWLIREKESNNVEIESVRDSEGSIATGISVVVPAKKILEVLRHPELEKWENSLVNVRLAAQGATTHC